MEIVIQKKIVSIWQFYGNFFVVLDNKFLLFIAQQLPTYVEAYHRVQSKSVAKNCTYVMWMNIIISSFYSINWLKMIG